MSWLKFVESAGNHVLGLDPDLLEQLKPFYGKTFHIEITEPPFSFELRACPDGFIIEHSNDDSSETPANVSLSGSLWAFARLAKEGAQSDVFDQGRIILRGDAQLGQDFQRVFSKIDIDWQALIAERIGQSAASNIHRTFDEFRSWFSDSSQQVKQRTGEVIQTELKLAPNHQEVNTHSDEIDTLRSDVARLEARIKQFINQTVTEDKTDA